MPQRRAATHIVAILCQANVEVVEKGSNGTDVKNAQPFPVFGQHPRQDGKKRGLGLAAGSRRQQQSVLASKQWGDRLFLQRPERIPAEAINDVVLKGWVKSIEIAHKSSSTSSRFFPVRA